MKTIFLALLLTSVAQAQQGPPIQKIASATAISTEKLGIVSSVRELPNGNVLVNDMQRRRVLLMDSTMKLVGVVLDSLTDVENFYGSREGGLLPFRGDTTFFLDPVSMALVVLDPTGKFVRVRSVWRAQDVYNLIGFSGRNGYPGYDSLGRIIYRIPAQAAPPKVRPPAGVPYFPQDPDSAFIVAAHLDTRKLDTLASIRTQKFEIRVRQTGERSFTGDMVIHPLTLVDEWSVLPDGTVAIIRGREYRIDYIHPDGKWTSSPKIAFDWQRLTDEDKQKIVDSVKVAQQKQNTNSFITSMIRWVNQYNRSYPKNFTVPEGFVPQPGLAKDWLLPPGVKFPANYIYACEAGAPQPQMGAGPPSCIPAPVMFGGSQVPAVPTPRPVLVASPDELPDYRPPFPVGAVRADMEGNIWVRTNPMKPTPGGPVFDVISPAGDLTARIQLLPGYSIVGFGKDKVVYLATRDQQGLHVARIRLK